jgi:predicted membrane protein
MHPHSSGLYWQRRNRENEPINTQAQLLWGLVFGSIGLAFFIYGKKQRAVVPLICGIALILFPYFVSNVFLLVGIGVLLVAIPCFLKL